MVNRAQHRDWTLKMGLRAGSAALAFAFVLLSGITPQSAQAQLFTVIYSFGPPPDGEYPWAGLVQDANGSWDRACCESSTKFKA